MLIMVKKITHFYLRKIGYKILLGFLERTLRAILFMGCLENMKIYKYIK